MGSLLLIIYQATWPTSLLVTIRTPQTAPPELGTRQDTNHRQHHMQHRQNWEPERHKPSWTPHAASPELLARQDTNHLEHHMQHHQNCEPEKTQTILSTTNSMTRSGSQTVKTQPIFSNTRTGCQTFGHSLRHHSTFVIISIALLLVVT